MQSPPPMPSVEIIKYQMVFNSEYKTHIYGVLRGNMGMQCHDIIVQMTSV